MDKNEKIVITYGTFDMFHVGHLNILKRSKELGDYLIVGVTSENYDKNRGKLNVNQSLTERIMNVKRTGLADKIIVEEYDGQKIDDIQKYNADIFAIGSDWKGKFDYLNEYCTVNYLERTKGISSTELRGVLKIGIVGCGRIAERFIPEARFVSGVDTENVYHPNISKAKLFCKKHDLSFCTDDFKEFLDNIDAVYIAAPHHTHYEYAKKALESGKHVLCEKPLTLKKEHTLELFRIAKQSNLVLMDAIKTAYCPGFRKVINLAKSGTIGKIKHVEATFTKLVGENLRELNPQLLGGSVTELSSYVLLPILKLCGLNMNDISFYSYKNSEKDVDLFTQINMVYNNCIGVGKVGLGVKSEGDLVISGTKGYIYVPSPWWKTEYFEIRMENFNENKRYCESFDGDGLRYEISEFVNLIKNKKSSTHILTPEESLKIIELIEKFLNNEGVISIN
ncbi:Gfo/Idh/MocA family oxidoreductase [Methanococcus sp. CF]